MLDYGGSGNLKMCRQDGKLGPFKFDRLTKLSRQSNTFYIFVSKKKKKHMFDYVSVPNGSHSALSYASDNMQMQCCVWLNMLSFSAGYREEKKKTSGMKAFFDLIRM